VCSFRSHARVGREGDASNRNRLQGEETGYFRHEHAGEDDRVFFSVKVNGRNSYEAKIRLLVNGAASSPNVAVSVIAKIVDTFFMLARFSAKT